MTPELLQNFNPFIVILNIMGCILVFYGLRKYTDRMPIRVGSPMSIWVLFDLIISVSLIGICGMVNYYSYRPIQNIYVIFVVEIAYIAYIQYIARLAIKLMNRQDSFKEGLQVAKRNGMTGNIVAEELSPTLDDERKYIIVQILVIIGAVINIVPVIFGYLRYLLA